MLLVPRLMLGAFGFPQSTPVFFPSQSGIFLLILGICYLLALREPALVKIIVISKAFAVVFLAAHSVLLSAPPSIWAAGVGDGAMLCTMCLALRRHRRLEGPGALKAARAEELHFSRGDG